MFSVFFVQSEIRFFLNHIGLSVAGMSWLRRCQTSTVRRNNTHISMSNHDKYILRPHLRINWADLALRDGGNMRRFSTQYPAYQRQVHSHLPSSRWGVQSGLATKTQRCTCIALSQITCSSSQTGNVTTRNARLSTVVKFTLCSIVITTGRIDR